MRRIKGYKSMSKERLLSALDESECNSIESAGSRNNFNNARIKHIKENFNKLRDRFFQAKNKRTQKKPLQNRKEKESF